jgi:predicted MPP superfamily phosphohydrolase
MRHARGATDWHLPARLRFLRRLVPHRRPRRTLRFAGVVLVALIGAWLGLLVGGRTTQPLGPVETEMTAHLSWSGETDVRAGPLGTLLLDTHDAPLKITVSVQGIALADAQAIVDDPQSLTGLQAWVTHDLRSAIRELIIRSVASAIVGALLLGLVVYRRSARRLALVFAASVGLITAGGGAAYATWNPRAISEPHYTGLLAGAPALVGNAKDIVAGFGNYSQELAKLVGNVSKLYDVTSTLPAYQPDPSTIRVLHVSDIHLNPAAWEVISSVSKQFAVQVIVDSGDISDHGSNAERRFVEPIKDLDLPYVWVRGNHDSTAIQNEMKKIPNVVVLDNGDTATVAGLKFIGEGDPRFTPDRSKDVLDNETLAEAGRILAGNAFGSLQRPDIAVVHDPTMARPLDGAVKLVLAGHTHRRATELMPEGTRLFVQGSTGGAGLRALEGEQPMPVELSVLYLDAATKKLQAWDDITIGGLGLTSAQIHRTLAPETAAERKAELDRKQENGPDPLPTPGSTPGATPGPVQGPVPTAGPARPAAAPATRPGAPAAAAPARTPVPATTAPVAGPTPPPTGPPPAGTPSPGLSGPAGLLFGPPSASQVN